MKCDKCGYSDNGTGDLAHTCFVHALKQEEHKMTDSEQQEFKKSQREFNQHLIDMDNKRKINQRIKELKDQCYIPIIDRDGDTEYDMEKFAQLVIRKCVQQIDQVKQTKAEQAATEYTQGFDHGMVIAIKTIKECFGVEL